jgi:hypothetical protein
MPTSAARQTNRGRRSHGRLVAGAVLPLLFAAGSPPALAQAKQTKFSGGIVSGTGAYAHLRGTVRLVLRGSTTATGHAFKLTFSGPSCASQTLPSPSRCVVLVGSASGKVGQAPLIPDIGAQYALAGSGRVAVLGRVQVTGMTRGLGFIARGRFPLTLTLRNSAGSVRITAQGPLVTGFSSPF